jgi:hypothetical protein
MWWEWKTIDIFIIQALVEGECGKVIGKVIHVFKILVYMIDAFENMLYVRSPTIIPYTSTYNVLKMLQITSKVMVHLWH